MLPDALRAAAQDRLPDGSRRVVLVVGAGLNAAAARGTSAAHSWGALLDAVEAGLRARGVPLPDERPRSPTALWESLLRAQAATGAIQPADAEIWLRNKVVGELRAFEEEAADLPLYREVLAWGLRDIVSLNFDLALPRASGRKRLTHTPSRDTGARSTVLDPSLHRRADLGKTRVWYPHGDTGRAETLKLGVYTYGRAIRALERAIGVYHQQERRHGGPGWLDAARELPDGTISWATTMLSAPILFAGVGLSQDEWPLWWLLHRRARLHARLPPEERPGAWTLIRKRPDGLPAHLRGEPAGVVAVEVPDHAAVWQAARELFTP